MNNSKSSNLLKTLILIARPAAGKSEIIHYLSEMEPEKRRGKFNIGKLEIIDDFPYLWRWFEEDEMFGKQSLYATIRQNSSAGAAEIQDAILAELRQFQKGVESADDITLVIIKINTA